MGVGGVITINGTEVTPTRFPDGTSQVWKLNPELLRPGSSVVVAWRFESEAEVMQLAQLATLLRHNGVRKTLDMRYLPYGRQDKSISNDATFALHTFASVLNAMGWAEVTMWDPHSPVARALIDRAVVRGFQDETLAVYH